MILCNELNHVSKNFSAVLDRSTLLWFSPSPEEVHKYAGTWVKDKEVYNFVGARLHATPSPSCRFYYHGQKWKQAGLQWKKMVGNIMTPRGSTVMTVQEIMGAHKRTKDQVAAWKQETGKSEQAYLRIRKAILIRQGKITDRSRRVSEGMRLHHQGKGAITTPSL
jgi:hypothetical protein